MKILVDEMPTDEHLCPFSELAEMSRYVNKTKRWEKHIIFDCKITREHCDLNCGTCSSLKLLETKE